MTTIIEAPPAPEYRDDTDRDDDDDDDGKCHRLVGRGLTGRSLCDKQTFNGVAAESARRAHGRCSDCGMIACPDCEAAWTGGG